MTVAEPDSPVPGLPIADLAPGTSILLTGDDPAPLESAFARFAAAGEGERSVVLATGEGGQTMQRALDRVRPGAGERASVLTAAGPAQGDAVHSVEDLGDLTRLGMELSNLVAEAQQSTEQLRSGIYLCSSICASVDDARSVFRFLNSNFLTDVRRGEGVGVCALDTSADLDVDVDSLVAGMAASFSATVTVASAGDGRATLEGEGLSGLDGPVSIDL